MFQGLVGLSHPFGNLGLKITYRLNSCATRRKNRAQTFDKIVVTVSFDNKEEVVARWINPRADNGDPVFIQSGQDRSKRCPNSFRAAGRTCVLVVVMVNMKDHQMLVGS